MTPSPKPTPSFPWLVIPPAGVLIVLFGVPLLLVLAVSFASRGTYGGVEWALTFTNYTSIADPLYLRIFWRSLWLAIVTTVICLAMGFPLAYVIARAPRRWPARARRWDPRPRSPFPCGGRN